MDRKDLMKAIMLATGMTFTAHAATQAAPGHVPAAVEKGNPQGFLKSGNPKAAGGPENRGVGNPFNAY